MDNYTHTRKHHTPKFMTFLSVNVNSLIQNQRRASLFNTLKQHNPDIVLINETKLNPKLKLEFKNYHIIRRDRLHSKQGGGVAMLIKNPLKIQETHSSFSNSTSTLETIIIKIKLSRENNLYIVCAYAPKGEQYTAFGEEFKKLFETLKLDDPRNYYIIAGDLNAKHKSWKNPTNNGRGIYIHTWLKENQISYKAKLYGSDIPTYPRCSSFLNIVIADYRLKIDTMTDHPNELKVIPYDSDHNALKFQVTHPTDTLWSLETHLEPHRFNFQKADWEKFKEELKRKHSMKLPNDRNLSLDEINDSIDKIENDIICTITKAIPKVKKRNSAECYQNNEIKKLEKLKSSLITKINNSYRKFNLNCDQQTQDWKDQLKGTRKLIKQAYSKSINSYWQNKIKNISTNSSTMFPLVNQLFRPANKVDIANLEIDEALLRQAGLNPSSYQTTQNQNKYLITNPSDKLNIMGNHFANIHLQNDNLGKEGLANII